MEPGYICGHEGTGIVHEVGDSVKNFKKGDRVIAPFLTCWYAALCFAMTYHGEV
jgi:threonine dehydrogenase-like Zn-dependent dehydrogenase